MDLPTLAAALADLHLVALEDLYIERRRELRVELQSGRIVARQELSQTGAAVRRNGTLRSADGLDRLTLGALLDVPARALPPTGRLAPAPEPALEAFLAALPNSVTAARWRWAWAAVVRPGSAVEQERPQLLELATSDGARQLTTWPPPPWWRPAALRRRGSATPPAGRLRVLLAPAAAGVLLHELVGHPLEGDLAAQPRGTRLHRNEAVLPLALDLADDPTVAGLPGSFEFDDEGERAARRLLLHAGRLVGFLCDRRAAAALRGEAGNARRGSVHSLPRPRISNLVADAPDLDPEMLRKDARLEVRALAGGVTDPATGLVRLPVRDGVVLRRGRPLGVVGPCTLVATLEAARGGLVAAAGPAEPSAEPGWCVKGGEAVATGSLSPWLLVDGLEAW